MSRHVELFKMADIVPSCISFFKVIISAHSNRWPEYSSFAVSLLCICVIFVVTQFTLILTLGIRLLQLSPVASCFRSTSQRGAVWTDVNYPVTFRNIHGSGSFVMRGNIGRFGIIYISMLMPVVIITLFITMGWMHFRKAGMANRTGVFWGFITMCLLFIGTIQDAWLPPDVHRHPKGTSCWQTPHTFAALRKERDVRVGLEVGSEVFSGLGALCMALYLALAISACQKNNQDSQTASTRLQDLANTSKNVREPTALTGHRLHPNPHPHSYASNATTHLPLPSSPRPFPSPSLPQRTVFTAPLAPLSTPSNPSKPHNVTSVSTPVSYHEDEAPFFVYGTPCDPPNTPIDALELLSPASAHWPNDEEVDVDEEADIYAGSEVEGWTPLDREAGASGMESGGWGQKGRWGGEGEEEEG